MNLLNSAEKEESEFLRCWASSVPTHFSRSQVCVVLLQIKLLQPEEYLGAFPTRSHGLHLVLRLLCWKSWWRCRSRELNACLRGKDLLRSPCRQEQPQPCLSIRFAKSLHIPSPPARLQKPSLSGAPLTKWASLLVSRGFIYMFFSLIRKENSKKDHKGLAFPIAVSLVVMIFEAILVSLCVPLNYPCICSAFSGLSVWNISKEDSSVSDGVNALFVCILKFK